MSRSRSRGERPRVLLGARGNRRIEVTGGRSEAAGGAVAVTRLEQEHACGRSQWSCSDVSRQKGAQEVVTLLITDAVAARIAPVGELDIAVTFVVEDGRITRLYAILNPHKLGRLEKVTELRR